VSPELARVGQEDEADSGILELIEALTQMSRSGIPYLVGGTYALRHYTGTPRPTKDLDVFVLPRDVQRVLDFFDRRGYQTELPYPHWLGKVWVDGLLVDVIFSSGNGVARVDEDWFLHSVSSRVSGVPVRLSPPEEMIWSKSFVQERERFDGADVLHLIRALGQSLNWPRLVQRFDSNWRVLLGHLVMFGYAYPDRRHQVPPWVLEELTGRLLQERTETVPPVCNGTLLSREQYLDDLGSGKYQDGRLAPSGPMTSEEIDIWTAAIDQNKH